MSLGLRKRLAGDHSPLLAKEALHKEFAFPQGLKPRLTLRSLMYGLKPVSFTAVAVPFKTGTYSSGLFGVPGTSGVRAFAE